MGWEINDIKIKVTCMKCHFENIKKSTSGKEVIIPY